MGDRRYNDFTGFTFDGFHSSDLNIVRVSGGDRYNDDLLPTFQDKTVQVGGRHGTYLFGSYYTKKDLPQIEIAFDNLSDENLRRLRNWGSDGKVHQLIFDETPYKYYNVKFLQPPQLKYICFDESENLNDSWKGSIDRRRRIYKGEGTLRFTCYECFARSTVLSKEDITGIESDFVRIYLDKNLQEPREIQLDCLDDVDEVQLYLSRDWLYDRGEWGAPDTIDGVPMPGQVDPKTGVPSTSYYAFQPQRVRIAKKDGDSTAFLSSDYQTYLFPIDFEKGFIGQIDSRTFKTNGSLVEKGSFEVKGITYYYSDALYDNHMEQRRAEIVQYDPSLKVTYGVSSEDLQKQEEYGCYKYIPITVTKTEEGAYIFSNLQNKKFNFEEAKSKLLELNVRPRVEETTTILEGEYYYWNKIESIPYSYASWDDSELKVREEYLGKEVYGKFTTLEDIDLGIVRGEIKNEVDLGKIFIVENAPNTLLPQKHSIFLLPNDEARNYYMEARYEKDGKPHTIKFEITLTDEDEIKNMFGNSNETMIEYRKGFLGNYIEWKDTINLPDRADLRIKDKVEINNCGDIDMPFKIFLENGLEKESIIKIDDNNYAKIDSFSPIGDDLGAVFDTELRILRGYKKEGLDQRIKYTNTVYNQHIKEGDFFTIPTGEWELQITGDTNSYRELQYEYHYF